MSRPATYSRLMTILRDGEWHSAEELAAVSHYTDHRLVELRHDGHQIETDSRGLPVVKLTRT